MMLLWVPEMCTAQDGRSGSWVSVGVVSEETVGTRRGLYDCACAVVCIGCVSDVPRMVEDEKVEGLSGDLSSVWLSRAGWGGDFEIKNGNNEIVPC